MSSSKSLHQQIEDQLAQLYPTTEATITETASPPFVAQTFSTLQPASASSDQGKEPDLVQRQRQTLHSFWQHDEQRIKGEEQAAERQKKEIFQIESDASTAARTAKQQKEALETHQRRGRIDLAQVKCADFFPESVNIELPEATKSGEAQAQLSEAVQEASRAKAEVEATTKRLQYWRADRMHRRLLFRNLAIFLLLLLSVGGYFGYQYWQNERLYQSAVASLEVGEWSKARVELQPLISIDRSYKDAPTLLRESYYQPAVAAIDAAQWAEAQTELQTLISMDSIYKDAPTLLRESYYQPAVAAIDAGQWEEARTALKQLLSIDGGYKDVPTLLRETYYQPAVAAIAAEQWVEAQTTLQSLALLDSSYKDVPTLLRESFYQPAVAAIAAGQWVEAQTELQTLISIDSIYRDAPTLLRESYYQPAVAAIDAGQWVEAAEVIVKANKLALGYDDTEFRKLISIHANLREALARVLEDGEFFAVSAGSGEFIGMSSDVFLRWDGESVPVLLNGESIVLDNIILTASTRSGNTCGGFSFELAMVNSQPTSKSFRFDISGMGTIWGETPPKDDCYNTKMRERNISISGNESIVYGFRELGGSGSISVSVIVNSVTATWILP